MTTTGVFERTQKYMWYSKIVGSLVFPIVFGMTSFAQKTIIIKLVDETEDRVTYDPHRVSTVNLHKWIQLSPYVLSSNKYRVPEMLEMCIKEDPHYKPCGGDVSSSSFLANAELNLRRIQQRINRLNPANYPAELNDVVEYLRAIQKFSHWAESHELQFLRTGDISYLEENYDHIFPLTECAEAIQRVKNAANLNSAHELVRVKWINCLVNRHSQIIGDYPLAKWNAFLKAYGIREQNVSTIDD